MIKKVTKNFIVYLNEAFQIVFARCRKTGKFVKHCLALAELELDSKYSCMTALYFCFMAFFNGCVFMSNSFDFKQIVLFNIVASIAILFTFSLSFINDELIEK